MDLSVHYQPSTRERTSFINFQKSEKYCTSSRPEKGLLLSTFKRAKNIVRHPVGVEFVRRCQHAVGGGDRTDLAVAVTIAGIGSRIGERVSTSPFFEQL
jgi:hypothetical protein